MHFSGETFYNRAFEQADGNLIQKVKPLPRTPHSTYGHAMISTYSWLLVPRLTMLGGRALCSLGKVRLQPTSQARKLTLKSKSDSHKAFQFHPLPPKICLLALNPRHRMCHTSQLLFTLTPPGNAFSWDMSLRARLQITSTINLQKDYVLYFFFFLNVQML